MGAASVEIKDSKTGVVTRLTTTDSGNYSTPPLIIGTYEVTFSKSGFQTASVENILLGSGQTVRRDATLAVGDVKTAVQVSAQGRPAKYRITRKSHNR